MGLGVRNTGPVLASMFLPVALTLVALLAGCASGPRGGRDGAGNPPSNLAQVPDAEPRIEPIRSSGSTSKPYLVLGRSYVPITDDRPFRESGLASWYGSKFNAQATASGEPYDMYAMTAAHKTLPLPSYVRVRNPANGREVIVRVNDRGPFRDDRIIDLSYTAALRLDLLRGVAPVEIERITNEDIRTCAWRRGNEGGTMLAQQAAPSATAATAAPSVPVATAVPAAPTAPMTTAAPVVVAAAAGSIAVPAAMTLPVVAQPAAESSELRALPPLAAQPEPGGPAGSTATGYWIQLGAFSQRAGALRLQQQVAREMPALSNSLNVFSESGTNRLQAGPYASRELAREAADQIRNGLQLAPMIVERR